MKGGKDKGGRPVKYAKYGEKKNHALEAMEKTGCDPFLILCNIANGDVAALGIVADPDNGFDPWIPPADRKDAAKEIVQYVQPKLKSVELTGGLDNNVTVDVSGLSNAELATLERLLSKASSNEDSSSGGRTGGKGKAKP